MLRLFFIRLSTWGRSIIHAIAQPGRRWKGSIKQWFTLALLSTQSATGLAESQSQILWRETESKNKPKIRRVARFSPPLFCWPMFLNPFIQLWRNPALIILDRPLLSPFPTFLAVPPITICAVFYSRCCSFFHLCFLQTIVPPGPMWPLVSGQAARPSTYVSQMLTVSGAVVSPTTIAPLLDTFPIPVRLLPRCLFIPPKGC